MMVVFLACRTNASMNTPSGRMGLQNYFKHNTQSSLWQLGVQYKVGLLDCSTTVCFPNKFRQEKMGVPFLWLQKTGNNWHCCVARFHLASCELGSQQNRWPVTTWNAVVSSRSYEFFFCDKRGFEEKSFSRRESELAWPWNCDSGRVDWRTERRRGKSNPVL